MINELMVGYEGKPCYNIFFQEDFFGLIEKLKNFSVESRKICIVSDSRVANIYRRNLEALLTGKCERLIFFIFPEGEASKNTDTIGKLYEVLIKNHFDRGDLLMALGGGVVGDMTGFAAATYLRGIDFIQIPTTLLSQVDSSIGGKTGVDHMGYKNMVGAFKMPRMVYMNLSVLNTLSPVQFASGMGEVIKHGLIRDEGYYEYIKEHKDKILALDSGAILRLVRGSCIVKREVVENDPTEKGERALLNFGHTIGHAIEKLSDFTLFHGQCVALGMVAAAFISNVKGYLSSIELDDIKNTLEAFDLPTSIPKDLSISTDEILNATKNDKKRIGSKIKFILLRKIGEAFIETELSEEEISEGIKYINEG